MEERTELAEYLKLVADLERNHDFRDYAKEEKLCKGCLQTMNFLVFSRQSECVKQKPVVKSNRKRFKKRNPLVMASPEDFSLQPPA